MRRALLVLGAAALILSSLALAGKDGEAPRTALTTENQKFSYVLGLETAGRNLWLADHIDTAAFMQGFQDGMAGVEPAIPVQEATTVKRDVLNAAFQQRGEVNVKAGQTFLAENKKKEGVVTTASGLQYTVLSQGSGPKPKATDTVVVNYTGTLLNGTVFDSSDRRGEPAQFRLDSVIRGWTEGVQLMSVGSKYRFFIPAELAYGAAGAGSSIEPNSALIFDVELLGIR